jgi:DNA-binding transcriptional LysR family regulator
VELHERHPQLDLEITAERRALSLKRHQSDIALRFARPEQGDITARRVVNMAYRFYAAPAWRSRIERGVPPRFVGFDEAGAEFPEALWLARQFDNPPLALRSNNLTGQIAAARAGFGVALLPCFLAADDPALVAVSLPKAALPTRELWLLTRRETRTVPRIRVVADFLVASIRREAPLFEGK